MRLKPEQTALWIARTPKHFDDTPRAVLPNATPPSDKEVRLAFAGMLELADRIDLCAQSTICEAPTTTGRAIRAAIMVAQAHQAGHLRVSIAEVTAARIVMKLVGGFLANKPPTPSRFDQIAFMRHNCSTLMVLGGLSGHQVGNYLCSDHSAISKRFKSDLAAIEAKYGHFCKRYKSLRRKWPLPQKPIPLEYNESILEIDEAFDADTLRLLDHIDAIGSQMDDRS
jgi:hypothetical protein